MKIGIITLNSHANYGGILQAYAMTRILSRIGHDAKVIYLPVRWSIPWYKYPYVITKRLIKKAFGNKGRIFSEHYYNKTFGIVSQYTQNFIDKHIPHIVVNRYKDLKVSDWDAFIVGSDQVWRPEYMGNHNIEHAFLSFAQNWNVLRIAYAASFGQEQWPYTQEQSIVFGKLLNLFDAVSVREASAVRMCMEHWKIKAQHVLDPTMLVPREEYEALVINSGMAKNSGDLLCYILDENEFTNHMISSLEKQYSLKPFRVNSKYEDYLAPINERIQPPVEKWLRGFMDAKMVVTDSFHACVFSIIFNKPFFVVGNKNRGMSRFESLLDIFGLKDRLIDVESRIVTLNNTINWDYVNRVMEQGGKKSLDFINTHL